MKDRIASDGISRYFRLLEDTQGTTRARRMRHQMEFQYESIDFQGRSVLDIGGGNGVHSFYAAARGAASVVTIEPELDGSTAGVVAQFLKWKEHLQDRVSNIEVTTFQEFEPNGRSFDVVIIQNAINHLDEDACATLDSRDESRHRYDVIFRKLAAVTNPGGHLLFSDCSSVNVYPALGLKNLFAPGIEWEKHQPPEKWVSMLTKNGFQEISTRWTTPYKLGRFGRVLGNKLLTSFYTSHFVVLMNRK